MSLNLGNDKDTRQNGVLKAEREKGTARCSIDQSIHFMRIGRRSVIAGSNRRMVYRICL